MTFARIFVMLIGGGMMWLGDQMYSKSIFFFGLALVILMALSFLLGFGRTEYAEVTSSEPQEQKSEDPNFVPLQYVKLEQINGHTQFVSWKGKGFIIWKKERGNEVYVQEVNKGGHPVGKPGRGSAKDAADYMKRKFKEL